MPVVRSPSARALAAGGIAATVTAILAPSAVGRVLPGLEVARGRIQALASYPDALATSFQSGVPLTVYVTYHPHTTVAKTTRNAVRVVGGGRSCPAHPTSRDEARAAKGYPAPGHASLLQFTFNKVRFPAGTSRVCAWFAEGRGFGKPQHDDLSFVPSLYGSALLQGSLDDLIAWTFMVRSTSPVKMTSNSLSEDSQGCQPYVSERVDTPGATAV